MLHILKVPLNNSIFLPLSRILPLFIHQSCTFTTSHLISEFLLLSLSLSLPLSPPLHNHHFCPSKHFHSFTRLTASFLLQPKQVQTFKPSSIHTTHTIAHSKGTQTLLLRLHKPSLWEYSAWITTCTMHVACMLCTCTCMLATDKRHACTHVNW